MRHKITLLTAAVVLAFMAGLTPRAFAQSYETEHASKIMLPSAGNNPAYTLTLVANGLTGNNILKFPDGNGSGGTSILTNDGTGVLSWTAPGLSTISPGLAGQFLVTNGSTAVQWLGLQINSDFTGNGITSNLAIAQTSAAGADIIAALTANAGNITNGTTGNAATATTATTATTASNVVTNTVSDNTSYYPALLSSATGAASTPVDVGGTGLSYNPSTGTLTATNFSGTSLTSTGTTTIDNSGSNAVNIGSGGTYTGIISIGDSATGDVSTTNIKGNVTFSGPVTLPPGSVTAASLGLTLNNLFVGNSSNQASALAPTANAVLITGGSSPFQTPEWATTLPTGLTLNNETIGGTTSINTSGSITGGAGSFTTLTTSGLATLNTATVTNNLLVSGGARVTGNDTTGGNAFVTGYQTITGGQQVGGNDTVLGTFYANGNSNIDASPSSGGTVTIGNSLSTTTINGTITYANAPSLPLAKNDIFIGDATGATADTAMVTQDVSIISQSTHVAQATVNGSHATTFAVTNAETVGTTLGVSGLATLNTATVTNNLLVSGGARVAGNDTTGGNAFVTGYQTITGGQQVGGNDTVLGTFYANGNSNIDASPSSGGTVTIGNSLSTTTINGTITYANAPSLPLAKNDIFIGDATGATADTAMVTQDVSIISQSTHVAQATVNGSHAATFAVTNAETVGGTLTSSGNVSLDASPSSGGTVVIGNSAGPSTTTINGALNITGTVTYTTVPSLPLPSADIFVGNGASPSIAAAVAMSGDATISNTGLLTIGNNKVTYGKMQAVSTTSRLLGSSATTTPVQEITLGSGLSITGSQLNTVNNGNVTSGTLVNNGAVYATSASAIASTTQMTAGQLLIGSGASSVPLLGTITTSGSGITATYTSPNIVLANTGVTSLSGGTTGLTDGTGTGTVTLTGTLISTNGGTGVSNPTAHDLLVAEGSTAMTPISGAAGTVLVGNGSSTDPSFSAVPTLGVPGTTAGTLTLASGAAAFSTTVQTSATTPASTYIYQLPAQPTGLPTAGNVLTIGTPTGTGPYTVPLTWTVPNSTTAVLYDQTSEQATIPISSTPATPSYLFNVGYNNTVVADSAAGAIINSVNTNTTAANAPLHNADGFTVNVTATGSGTFYGNATGLIVNATAPVGGIPTGVAVTISGDTIGPAFQLHNKTQGSFYGARSIISTVDSDLEFKETGDKYGTSILDIQNRTGSNGALFQTISNAADTGTDVIDWGFIPGNGTQSNIRLEARHKWASGVSPNNYGANEYLRSSANITSASPEEFQYFFGTTGATPLYTLSIGENATLLERGNFGIGYGTNSPGGDTAQGSPRVRLDVHGRPYYGNLSDVGYSGASNILLSDTGTSSFTAPFVGAMEFQGTNDGISSFAAGAEASRYINYTWPTLSTAPTANQVLSISTISGSGTLATPYLAQLTWATASGSSTGVNFNVTTAQTAAVAANNYLFDVGYTNTAVDDSVVGAVITSTNTSTSNGGSSTSNHGATGLTVNATATSSTSFHGNSTAIFANATANTGGTATGLNLNVTGGTTDVDILGTAGWSVSSVGAGTFASMNLGTGALSTVGNITIDGSAERTINMNAPASSGTGDSLTINGANGTTSGGGGGIVLNAGNGVGTNQVGGDVHIYSGNSTGDDSSSIVFFTPLAGASGTTAHAATESMRIGGQKVLLSPYGTSTGNTFEMDFKELAANGTNYVGFKAPDALSANNVYVLPAYPTSTGLVLTSTTSGGLSWTTNGSSGSYLPLAGGTMSGAITFSTAGTTSAPNITSNAGTAMYVQAGTSTTTNAAGPAVTLQAGTGNGTGIGGGLQLWGGTPGSTSGNSAGGYASLDGANSADGVGGADSVNAGNGGTNGAGGTVYLAAGNGAGSGAGGSVTLNAGTAGTTGAGGSISMAATNGGTTSGGPGDVSVTAGNGVASTNRGGNITLTPGSTTGSGGAGYIDLNGPVYAAGSASVGTAGQVLTSEGPGATTKWTTPGSGSYTGYRAGTVTMSAGNSTAAVSFSSALSATTYRVSLSFTNNPDLTSSSGWGYLSAGSKSTSGFTITLYNSQGGAYNVPSGQSIVIDWIAIPAN